MASIGVCIGQDASAAKARISFMDECDLVLFFGQCLLILVDFDASKRAFEESHFETFLGVASFLQILGDDAGFSHVARFAARRAVYASKSDRIFCVVPSSDGDLIRADARCSGSKGFDFAIPPELEAEHKIAKVAPELGKAWRICVGFQKGKDKAMVGVDQQCESLQSLSVDFKAPSLLDIAASTPSASASTTPLFTIVEEEVLCFGFLCPHVLSGLK